MLVLRKVFKDYFSDKKSFRALSDISLSFPDSQFVSILGPSGCGKTTLLNLIGGLDSVTSGDILSDGRSLAKMTPAELDSYRNNRIGFIYQNYYLIPQLSVLENVEVALAVRDYSQEDVRSKAVAALTDVGLTEFQDKKPSQLSGGQQQRAAIARAIVTDPSILLADEPTGSLDSQSAKAVMDILARVSVNRLVIMVTHNEELAATYSQRIIRLYDGRVQEDMLVKPSEAKNEKEKELRKSKLSFGMKLKLAWRNVSSRRWKTGISSVASSLGMLGIGFFLAINTGFAVYSGNLSTATASSLPVVISSYNIEAASETDVNRQKDHLYPTAEDVYPQISLSSSYTYQSNSFSQKYLNYLASLQKQNIAQSITVSYGNSYSYNLMTDFPESLDGKNAAYAGLVTTSLTVSNNYASQAQLPTNIFHVLYGDTSQYDVIAGRLPTTASDLVLVVDSYNEISFRTLRALGFYSRNDTEAGVKMTDTTDATRISTKPISFASIVGKIYHSYTNEELYQVTSTATVTDAFSQGRTITSYAQKTDVAQDASLGKLLSICGIIRPKSTSSYSILSPSLCFTSAFQDSLTEANLGGPVSKTIRDNAVFIDAKGNGTPVSDFQTDIQTIFDKYDSGSSDSDSYLPYGELNAVFDRYFDYYSSLSGTRTSGLSRFRSEAAAFGIDIIPASLKGKDFTNASDVEAVLTSLKTSFTEGDYAAVYDMMLGLNAYLNTYSLIQTIVIFPASLSARSAILKALDSFNVIESGSENHAADTTEQVKYSQANVSWMIEDVSSMISLASTILIIYAVVTLTIAIVMIALLTSNNVLERRTEIGLLRSLGTRKSDIVMIFEIEAFFIGLISGLIGSLLTYILTFPINYLINSYYPGYAIGAICDFTWYHALILVAVSIGVALIAALIPALKAGRENPVECLRRE
jgi:putative ABC transport system permease protein